MMLLEPRAYSESQQIADYLKAKNQVVVNFKRVTSDVSKRISILENKYECTGFDNPADVLVRENYFFVNAYRHVFLKSENDNVFINILLLDMENLNIKMKSMN